MLANLQRLPLAIMLLAAACCFSGKLSAVTIPLPEATANYWVYFADKNIQSESDFKTAIAAVESTYSAAAIERRSRRGTGDALFGYNDINVAANYVDALSQSGVGVRHTSSWLNAVSITATADQLASIGQLSFVDRVRPVAGIAAPQRVVGAVEVVDTGIAQAAAGFYGSAEAQLTQINIPAAHALGYTGSGVTIGVLDTGFIRTHQAFNEPGHVINVLAERDFVAEPNDNNTADTSGNQHLHGTYILGVMGGYKPNTYVGGAYDASFLLAKTENVPVEVQAEEDDWVAGLQWLEMNGADLVTSSLGYIDWYLPSQLDGNTAVTTIAADMAAAMGLPIVNAAGNRGQGSNRLIAPADGDLVITVGAVDSDGDIAYFSSSGPTADFRLKPEVLALGVGTSTVNPNSTTGYANVSGTSLSTPLVASTVALMLQANPNLSVEQIRDILFTTASRAGNPDTTTYAYGYGVIDAFAAVQAAEAAQAQPVPEPSSWALAVAALLLAFAWSIRRRKSRAFAQR